MFDPGWKGPQAKHGAQDTDTEDWGNDPGGVINRYVLQKLDLEPGFCDLVSTVGPEEPAAKVAVWPVSCSWYQKKGSAAKGQQRSSVHSRAYSRPCTWLDASWLDSIQQGVSLACTQARPCWQDVAAKHGSQRTQDQLNAARGLPGWKAQRRASAMASVRSPWTTSSPPTSAAALQRAMWT